MIVGRFSDHPEARKGARRRAQECARRHAQPVLHDLLPMFVEPKVRLFRDGDVYVVERVA